MKQTYLIYGLIRCFCSLVFDGNKLVLSNYYKINPKKFYFIRNNLSGPTGMSEFVIDGEDAAATHHNNFEFEASVDSENLRSLDDRINCKIAAGMKKAIHLIVQRFDNLFQQKLKMLA